MPDTYTSQFSGEEIDAALRAAQIISGASTPAELRKKLEIRGDTIPVSATDPTPISEALTASGGGINPNLLDNWFFGRPVNQRNGYIIPAGVEYNDLSWNHAGTTDKAYPVVGYIGQDPLITIDGTNYIVGAAVQVPGYCGEWVYTIDRWEISEGTLTVNDGSISHSGGHLFHPLSDELSAILKGKRLTLSFLYADGSLESASAVVPSTWGTWDAIIDYASIRIFGVNNGSRLWVTNVSTAPLLAAKLELGGVQTLAHKENEKRVLNEIPNFGEQLRRCQRYHLGDMQRDAPGRISENNTAYCVVPIPVTMRQSSASPVQAISKYGTLTDKDGASHVVNNAYCVVEADSYLLFAVVSTETMPVGPCVWQDAHFSVSKDL